MTTLKAVIGANLGDEGKGKMTDYFTFKSQKPCLVVCSNGGAQRGHTVVTPFKTHIFHHFGSGTLAGADTYLPAQYIINPIIFMKEYKELSDDRFITVWVNENCLCSTPYDMMANQIIEESRGNNKHGSCGVGIWETILRNEATIGELIRMPDDRLRYYLKGVRDAYFANRFKNKKIDISKEWGAVYYSDALIEHYINDFKEMVSHIRFAKDSIFKNYETVIFENGQGLMLDQNITNPQYSTPSNTGSQNIKEMVDSVFDDYEIELCYVTRTYLTRHGNGELARECNRSHFDIDISTETNIWNKNQGAFRYGLLNMYDLIKRIDEDYNKYWANSKATKSLAVTHIDECEVDSVLLDSVFDKTYYSYGAKREEIFDKCGG